MNLGSWRYLIAAMLFSACVAPAIGAAPNALSGLYENAEDVQLIAQHADHALLAAAAYEDASEEYKQIENAFEARGWVRHEPYSNKNIIVGDTVATLFKRKSTGEVVLSFRGTSNWQDWITNFAGTLSADPLTNAQINGARAIARHTTAKYPNIVFVGHSLGGRLAQVARLTTGKDAIVFNSAPLSPWDQMRAGWPFSSTSAQLRQFRAPLDILSKPSREAISVKSIGQDEWETHFRKLFPGAAGIPEMALPLAEMTTANSTTRVDPGDISKVLFGHSSWILAQGMEEVRLAAGDFDQYSPHPAAPRQSESQAEWFKLIVPEGRIGNGYSHWQTVNIKGQRRIHPGIDIGARCGAAVRAADDGEVVRVVTSADADFGSLGNAAVVRHADFINGVAPSYTLYLHMQTAPIVKTGSKVSRGDEIGKVGDTGFAEGCHVHFEARQFEGIRNVFHEDAKNVYLPADWGAVEGVATEWANPESFALAAGREFATDIDKRFFDGCRRSGRDASVKCPLKAETCMGEGCRYSGNITTVEEVPVFLAPSGRTIIRKSLGGEVFDWTGSVVYSTPCRGILQKASGPGKPGDTVQPTRA